MPTFRFIVKNPEGKVRTGAIRAASQAEAEAKIAQQGFELVELTAAEDRKVTPPIGSGEPASGLPEEALPGNAERFAQNRASAETFVGAGYRRIGLDHFAKDDDLLVRRQYEGRLHRNFQGYTTDDSPVLIGFGPSAIGFLPGGYVQNAPGIPAYRAAIAGGRFATVRGCPLTAEDRLRAAVIERLMCDLHVDLATVCRTHGTDPAHFAEELAAIDALAEDGIVARDDDTITVPEHARVFVRAVCAVFDTYLAAGETRFSRAS